jgi:solute:Na+ symporter, SSS family
VVIIGAATMTYTYYGGIVAVIWTDVIQLVVYLSWARSLAAFILVAQVPGGWSEMADRASDAGQVPAVRLHAGT